MKMQLPARHSDMVHPARQQHSGASRQVMAAPSIKPHAARRRTGGGKVPEGKSVVYLLIHVPLFRGLLLAPAHEHAELMGLGCLSAGLTIKAHATAVQERPQVKKPRKIPRSIHEVERSILGFSADLAEDHPVSGRTAGQGRDVPMQPPRHGRHLQHPRLQARKILATVAALVRLPVCCAGIPRQGLQGAASYDF